MRFYRPDVGIWRKLDVFNQKIRSKTVKIQIFQEFTHGNFVQNVFNRWNLFFKQIRHDSYVAFGIGEN